MNPMQLMQMFRSGEINPEQLAINLIQQNMGDMPMGQNLLSLAQKGDGAGIEKVVRNLAKERGIDFDKEFAAFRRMTGL